ncbi:MAG: hypothetical protein GX102_16195 [Porphyromonadaceae bacterium]|nr:hypothetical protein [Porphyromonadaceae bacterium]
MELKTNWLNWIFRLLALAAVVIAVISFTQPWWKGFISGGVINIYGWGLRHTAQNISQCLVGDVTPDWQVGLAWGFVTLSSIVAIIGVFIKRWWGSLLTGIAGVGFITYAYTAMYVVISDRLADFSAPLEGYFPIGIGVVTMNASIQSSYYLVCVAGGIMLLVAIAKGIAAFTNSRKASIA